MTATLSVHIEAPVTAVFDLFRNPANWQDVAEGVEFTGVHVTREGLGTHYTWRARFAGVTVEGFDVFTEFIPDRRITDRSSLSLEGTWTYTFEPEGSGTKLTLTNRGRGLWRLPLLRTLLDHMTVKSHERVLTRLKNRLETGADE
jgi:hypothetical protein